VLVLKICVSRYNKSGEGPVSAFCPTWLNGELKEHSNGTQPQTHTHTHICTLDMHMCVFKWSFLFFWWGESWALQYLSRLNLVRIFFRGFSLSFAGFVIFSLFIFLAFLLIKQNVASGSQ